MSKYKGNILQTIMSSQIQSLGGTDSSLNNRAAQQMKGHQHQQECGLAKIFLADCLNLLNTSILQVSSICLVRLGEPFSSLFHIKYRNFLESLGERQFPQVYIQQGQKGQLPLQGILQVEPAVLGLELFQDHLQS